MKKKILVDNTGRGNCMYYAYGISLMYFLRDKSHKETTDRIFEKLGLDIEQKDNLHRLLKNNKNKPFSESDRKTIIEPVLGPAARKLASEATKSRYDEKPADHSLFAAANYGMCHAFKSFIDKIPGPCRDLINNKLDENYTKAEIFKVKDISTKMKTFASEHYLSVINTFDQLWSDEAHMISKKLNKEFRRIYEDDFYKEQFLNEIIGWKTLKFLKEGVLDTYITHLNTNFTWGTEETLLTLHRAIQGEKVIYENEKAKFEYETPIQLNIYSNGRPATDNNGTDDMVLNNKGNTHWTSLVEPHIWECKTEKETRDNLLDIAGFNNGLDRLGKKLDELEFRYPAAFKEASQIYNDLIEKKNTFLSEGTLATREKDTAIFIQDGLALINTAEKTEISKHRGYGATFNTIINVLVSIATFEVLNWSLARLNIIDPLKTDTYNKISSLKYSLGNITNTYKQKTADLKDIGESSAEQSTLRMNC